MTKTNLKLKTIIDKIQNGAITNITLEVYEANKLLEAKFAIDLRTAVLLSFNILCDNSGECFELIKSELKNKGILFIRHNNIDFDLERFDINL